jgi:hypothetical protein
MARMEKVYSSLFGTESTKGLLYGGFYTMLGGVFLGLAGLVLFFVAQQYEGNAVEYRYREAAIVLGALATIAIFYGISLTLPSKRGMRIAQSIGAAVCVAATLGFVWAYPINFNVPGSGQADYSGQVAGAYALGIVVLIAGTFTSLIGYYLDRIQAASGSARGGGAGGDYYDEYEVPDSVIEKDIEYAMRKYKYAWGEGPDATASTIQINVKDDFEAGTVVGGKGVARTVTLDAPQVDDATKALRGIRPSREKELPTSEVDAQTNALLAFRKQKFAQVEAKAALKRLSWWQRLLIWLGLKRPPTASDGAQKVGAK